ncbi:hypothetical protein CFP56_021196 [Quercus suber]|uniref:Uncharacterized protein n=1 Tax=Quercus suber TaxID=58331 RepID=A0AAW0KG77_QUESU
MQKPRCVKQLPLHSNVVPGTGASVKCVIIPPPSPTCFPIEFISVLLPHLPPSTPPTASLPSKPAASQLCDQNRNPAANSPPLDPSHSHNASTEPERSSLQDLNAGHTVHIAVLMRLNIEESSVDSIYITVWGLWASPYLPLHMGKTGKRTDNARRTFWPSVAALNKQRQNEKKRKQSDPKVSVPAESPILTVGADSNSC